MAQKMFDAEIFRDRLMAAIGDRSKAEYARAAGITPQRLNTLLNNATYVPTLATLKRLAMAAENGITLNDLAEAVGYLPEDIQKYDKTTSIKAEREEEDIDTRNELAEKDLVDGVRELIRQKGTYKNLQDFIDMYKMLYEVEDCEYEVGEPQELNLRTNGEGGESSDLATLGRVMTSFCTPKVYPVTVTWVIGQTTNIIPMLLYAIPFINSMLILEVSFSAKEMADRGLLPKEVAIALEGEDLKKHNPAHIIRDGRPKTDREKFRQLELMMHEEEVYGVYPYTAEGPGFRIASYDEEGNRTELLKVEPFCAFADKHSKAFVATEEMNERDMETAESMKKIAKKAKATPELLSVNEMEEFITCVIRWEKNIQAFCYDYESESTPENIPVIMVDSNEYKCTKQNEENMLRIFRQYAKELGLKRYGTQYYTMMYPKQKSDEYEV